ncbi:MAG: signal peptidase I [Actinobacteria bacterium]|nr:signal peptidase I [Actinomycetota bacterium]
MRFVERSLSRLLELAVYCLVAMALLCNFLIIAQALFSPLNEVQGDSMEPTIRDSDAVLVAGVQPEGIKPGDVIIFPDPEDGAARIVHRVVSMQERDGELVAVTKGDGNTQVDPFVIPARKVQGKVRLVLPMGGAFLRFLGSPGGFVLCVLCPFLLLALFLTANYYKESRGDNKGILLRQVIRA